MVVDHKGNEFKTKKDRAVYYGVKTTTIEARLKMGWSLQEALEGKEYKHTNKACKDHLGNKYESLQDMCRHYGIEIFTFKYRLKRGYSLEKSLTYNAETYTDHKGNKFNSIVDMCKYWNITEDVYRHRRRNNWDIEKILTTKCITRRCTDHLGNEYESLTAMCKHYELSNKVYKSRIAKGMTIQEALETQNKVYTDHKGNKFDTLKNMCDYWGIYVAAFKHRINTGWTLETALETPVNKSEYERNSSGIYKIYNKQFNTLVDICKYYGVSFKLLSKVNDTDFEKSIMKHGLFVDKEGNKFFTLESINKHYSKVGEV